jgi:hypothetical protein
MRFALPLLLLIAFAGVLRAQDNDPRMQQILNPDYNMGSALQNKSYYSGGAAGLDTTKSANVKDFYFVQKFSSKSFETKEFAAKDFWGGDFQFATKAAYVKTDSAADKIFETKSAPVKEAHESGKDYGTKGYETREADEKGKTSQEHLDEIYKGKNALNMNQVRDLLNKNH